jgi:hypothetical protein
MNVELVSRVPYRDIERRFGVGRNALKRHAQEHIPKLLVESSKAVEVANADSLLERLEGWAGRIETAIDAVEGQEDYGQFWKGVSVLRPYLETIGEITKELERRPQVNILIAPQVQQVIINALAPYPDARKAVVDALAPLEATSS